MENVEVDLEEEDSEDEVLVLEDTTGGQDRESAEVIIYVSVIRLSRVADPEQALSGSALKSKFRSFRGSKWRHGGP